jgi:hypothetical protein
VIYLASPYSHRHAMVREHRYHDACVALANLLRDGHSAFSPIVHGHPLAMLGLPTDWSYWEAFDRDHISRCDQLAVLTIDGWESSVGVRAEIAIAEELGKPVWYLSLEATVSPTLARVAAEGGS